MKYLKPKAETNWREVVQGEWATAEQWVVSLTGAIALSPEGLAGAVE